jgi:hypothetical protein
MRKFNHSIILLSFALLSLACSKNADKASEPTSGLNAVENTVKGKWFLKSKSDTTYINNTLSMATTATYTVFQGVPYIELYTTKSQFSLLGGASAKDAKDVGSNLGSMELGPPLSITGNGFWYYDETAKMFVWGGLQLHVVKATSTDLELKFSSGNYSQIGFNLTWKFKR